MKENIDFSFDSLDSLSADENVPEVFDNIPIITSVIAGRTGRNLFGWN